MSKWLKKITIIILSVILLISPVSADFATQHRGVVTGKFMDSVSQIYSGLKAMGYSDIHISGVLSNFIYECSCDHTTIEVGDGPVQRKWKLGFSDETYEYGPIKDNIMKNMAEYTRDLFDARGGGLGNYYFQQEDGSIDRNNGFVGIGIGSWTGPGAQKLLRAAEEYCCDWYDIRFQLCYILASEDDGSKATFEKYKSMNFSSATAAADWIFGHHEYKDGRTDPGHSCNAPIVLQQIQSGGIKYDSSFGKQIVEGTKKYARGEKLNFKEGGIQEYDAKDFIVKQEVLSPTSNIDITNGSTFTTTDEEEEERERLNVEILSSTIEGVSTNKKTYSLYNRFGPKIRFIEYFGEATSEVKLFDHVVSLAAQNSLDSITITDAINYDSGIYLSSNVYDKRPPVASIEMLSSGMQDERTKLYNSDTSGKRFAVTKGNLFLNISNSIVSFVNLLLGKEVYTAIKDKLYDLTDTSVWENIVHPVINIIYILGIIGVIISITLYAYKYLRNGNATLGQLIARCAVSFLAIIIIFGLKSNPKFLINTSYKIVTITDNLFDESINDVFEGDEVIASDDGNNIREAAIWKTAVFEPWCKGTFGKKYENLYTQYSDKTAAEKLEQSYEEDEKNPKNVDSNGIFYNSAALTGDIVVDRGNGKQVRNWAALAYSTQSKYHIDETMYINSLSSVEGDVVFPNALKTADNNIYADTFRWIDAKMDISPQYSLEGDTVSEVPNYSGSKQFETHYIKHGREALLKSALLLFMLPVILFKLWAFVKLLLLFVSGLVRSFQELFKEGEGLSNFWRDAKDNVVNYFYRSAQLYILIMLYIKFINKDNVLFIFAYIVLAIILTITSPRDIIYAVRRAKNFKSRYI